MSVLYFLIADKQSQKDIGCYMNEQLLSDEALEEIKQKVLDLLSTKTQMDKSKRYKNELQHTSLFYYLSLPSTLYISAVNKGSYFALQENLLFELIEDVDSQGIRKLVDKQGHLIKVALQNLRYSIDKYQSFQNKDKKTEKQKEIIDHSLTSVPFSNDLELKELKEKPISIDNVDSLNILNHETASTPDLLKDDIIIIKKTFRYSLKLYIFIGAIILLMLISIIIVYRK